MIKNRPALESQFPHSEHALDMLEAGLNAFQCLKTLCCHILKNFGKKIHIISYGKAAYTMALTASKHIKVAGGLIVAPKGKRMNAIPGLQMHYAAHPIPDRCSTTAAHARSRFVHDAIFSDSLFTSPYTCIICTRSFDNLAFFVTAFAQSKPLAIT